MAGKSEGPAEDKKRQTRYTNAMLCTNQSTAAHPHCQLNEQFIDECVKMVNFKLGNEMEKDV